MSVTDTTQHQWFRSYVQTLMSAILEEPAQQDADGDYSVQGETAQAWVRVDTNEPLGVQVFAIAATGVPAKLGVLREINDANLADPAIRVVLPPHGSLMVDYRLFADAVTEDNLRAVIGRVLAVADRIGPLVTTVHGGSTPISVQPSASDH